MNARCALSVVACLSLAAGCGRQAPVPEDKAVRDSYQAALFVPDPDVNTLILHAAWLGPDAVPPILDVWPSAATNDVKRAKLARMLEVLAWNGFRTEASVKVLASLSKDRNLPVRKSAISGLFASMADLGTLDAWWDPGDATPGRTWNPATALKLPYANCRELLAKKGVAIAKNPDGTIAGDPGRTHAAQPPVAQALSPVRKWWSLEADAGLRIYSAILALRTKDAAAAEPLVLVLQPLPEGQKPSQTLEMARACSVRALQEFAGEPHTTFEEWSAWREKTRPKPPTPKR